MPWPNKEVPVYGDGMQIRDWLHVSDHCQGIDLVLHKGKKGEIYNIGGGNERTNLQIVKSILAHLQKPESLIRHVRDRLGHDCRYAIDSAKIRQELGWLQRTPLEEGLKSTVLWYLDNQKWWEKVKSRDYLSYYERMYGNR